MEDDPGAAEDDERTIELSSIAAIYPELIIDPKQVHSATLELAVKPLTPLRIFFRPAADSAPPVLPTPPTSAEQGDEGREPDQKFRRAAQPGTEEDEHELSYLPPLILRIALPEGYPSENPPLANLSVLPPWVPKSVLKRLKADCDRLWEELGKDQVVYTYIDHLQQEGENAFGLTEQGNMQLSSDLKIALLDFDLKTKREVFEKETFDCGICLEPKKGLNCHRILLCSHVFCVACLQDFYNTCISEGDVDNVKCMDPNCGKDRNSGARADNEPPRKQKKQDRTLNPSELLQIPLEQEVVQRYVRLKRKKRLESDKNTVYCPRQWCQGAARSKKHPKPIDPLNDYDSEQQVSESEPENSATTSKKVKREDPPMSERLAVCEDCDYAFCSVCMRTWHGELANCNPRRQRELNDEEKASIAYLQSHTTACPTCSAPSQKSMGCNHMICFKCATHFCYLCSSYLLPDNPYRHFNDLKSTCYMRLWELEGGDGDDVGVGFAGGPGPAGGWDQESSDESDINSDSDDEADFAEFGGDDFNALSDEEEDTSDDEPAPDQRRPDRNRNIQVEMINFAREGGAANQRVIHNVPQRPREQAAPPAAPAPPRNRNNPNRRGGGQVGNRQRQMQREPARAVPAPNQILVQPLAAPPAGDDEEEAHGDVDGDVGADDEGQHIPGIRAAPAPGQGNGAAQQPAPVRQLGLERFLAMAARDEEDEWDSDELDEDMEVQREQLVNVRRERGRRGGRR